MNLYRIGLKNTLFNYAGMAISALCSFLIVVVISRSLSVEDFGVYNLLLSFLAYISVFSSFGLPLVLRRYVPHFYEKGDYNAVKQFLFWGMIFRFVTSVICVGLCLVFIEPLSRLLKVSPIGEFFFVFGFSILAMIQVKTLESVLEAMLLHNYTNIIRALYSLLQFGAYYYAVKEGLGLKGIILAYFLTSVFLLLAYLAVGLKKIALLPKSTARARVPFKKIVWFGLFNYFNDTTYIIFDFNTDFFVISFFLGSSFVGLYSFAASTVNKLYSFLPISVASTVLFPILVRKYSRSEDREELRYLFQLYNKMALFFGLPVAVGLFVLARKIITYVFHPQYLVVANIFQFIGFVQIIYMFSTGIAYFVQILEKVHYTFIARIFVVYNVVMDIVLLKVWGLMGVAVATASAWLFNAVFVFLLIRRDVNFSYPLKAFLRIGFNSLFMGGVLFILQPFVNGVASLIAVGIFAGLLYLGLNWFIRAFEERDLEVFNKMVGVTLFK